MYRRHFVLGTLLLTRLSHAATSQAVTPRFADLLSSYPKKNERCRDKDHAGGEAFEHQCAIRMSIALNGEGSLVVNKRTYSDPTCSHGHARGAQSLADWLSAANHLGRPRVHSSRTAYGNMKQKRGIVFIRDCFRRDDGTAGDHIDLWLETTMKSQPAALIQQGRDVWFWELD